MIQSIIGSDNKGGGGGGDTGGGGGETAVTLTPAANVNIDASAGTIFTLDLDQDTNLTVSGAEAADSFRLVLKGDKVTGASGYDFANISYTGSSFFVGPEDGSPYGLTFNLDGTKMYFAGLSADAIYQYTLASAWNLATASYDGVALSVGSEDNTPLDVSFKPDGTVMYMVGNGGDSVYQYGLTTAWDISTATYSNKSFVTTTQDASPVSVYFKPDGMIMYIAGNSNEGIFQYDLTTAWDVSTAVYSNKVLDVTPEGTNPASPRFTPDGTQMFVLITNNDEVCRYDLSTAWDVSTATYSGVSFSVTTQDGTPKSIDFSQDGSFMYMLGASNDSVYQYSAAELCGVTYPSNFKWPAGKPSPTPSAGITDMIKALTYDGGTSWLAWKEGANFL